MTQPKRTAVVTGAARRIGAKIVKQLHQHGYDVIIHYRKSDEEAKALAHSLNEKRADSAEVLCADLNHKASLAHFIDEIKQRDDIYILVNNASSFYPNSLQEGDDQDWDLLINSNVKAGYFLSAALEPTLSKNNGCIINLVDIHAERGLAGYPIYSIAKAATAMMTKSLAKELAPNVRVNGVSPGPILWPEEAAALSDEEKQKVVDKTLLQKTGTAKDIADAVMFLAHAPFVTGQILAVDGGKSLYS